MKKSIVAEWLVYFGAHAKFHNHFGGEIKLFDGLFQLVFGIKINLFKGVLCRQ